MPILRANGFAVAEVNTYEAMFELIQLGRADLFCRSVLEVGDEMRAHAGAKGLALDDSLLLAYQLPQYLYTHPATRRPSSVSPAACGRPLPTVRCRRSCAATCSQRWRSSSCPGAGSSH